MSVRDEQSAAERREFERELLYGELGETIGALIAELGISQRQLAERMGLSESRVSRIIGADGNATLKTVADVGFALGLRFRLSAEELPDRESGPAGGDSELPDWLLSPVADATPRPSDRRQPRR